MKGNVESQKKAISGRNNLTDFDTPKRIKQTKVKKNIGVYEWASYSLNFQKGCKNNCRYCYAKNMALNRFKRIQNEEEWKNEILTKPSKSVQKHYDGRIMYPTTHDIHEGNIKTYFQGLNCLLFNNNEVLITTKPELTTIIQLINLIDHYHGYHKELVQFRFTITSDKDPILHYWEPGAPNFFNRLHALKYAFNKGYKTSVSMEPFLSDPIPLIEKIQGYVSESIWIGTMNKRCISKEDYQKVSILYEKQYLQALIELYQDHSLIRFKDSVQRTFKVDMKGRALIATIK